MSEHEEAIILANKILDRTHADPDDDLAMLSRQFLRSKEGLEAWKKSALGLAKALATVHANFHVCLSALGITELSEFQRKIIASAREKLTESQTAFLKEFGDIIEKAMSAQELDRDRNSRDAYNERNRLVALLARMFPSGLKRTDIDGWDPEWQNCVYIDLPTGQTSWHYHDSEAHLFAGLAPYEKPWDGHTTDLKYQRVSALALLATERCL